LAAATLYSSHCCVIADTAVRGPLSEQSLVQSKLTGPSTLGLRQGACRHLCGHLRKCSRSLSRNCQWATTCRAQDEAPRDGWGAAPAGQ